MSIVDGSVLVVYQGAFLRRSAILVSGLKLVAYHRTVMVQGPGIVAFAQVRASARARAGSAAWCRRPAAMLSQPAMRSRLMATLRQVAMTRGACPVRTWDWSSA